MSRSKRAGRLRHHVSIRATASLTAAAIGCSTAAVSTRVSAQTPSPLPEWQYSVGVPLQKMWSPQVPDWQVALGLATSLQPRYPGSERYHAVAGPSIDIRYKDLFFASTGEGVGANVLQGDNWRTSIAAVYDLGRRGADDPAHLNGLGNINPAPGVKLSGDYVVSKDFPLVLRADLRRYFGGSNGWIGDLGAYLPLPGSSERFFWFAGPNVTLADSTYMNSWFGVNRDQAARSQYPYYHASAGFRSVGFGVSAVWMFSKHWFATADAALEQFVGSAARSPITRTSTNGVGDISINYRF